jgi:hypothetical protein
MRDELDELVRFVPWTAPPPPDTKRLMQHDAHVLREFKVACYGRPPCAADEFFSVACFNGVIVTALGAGVRGRMPVRLPVGFDLTRPGYFGLDALLVQVAVIDIDERC